ncbi:hypothetical protein CDL15_Pgr016808 [Punica granatum]|uniref:Uncharacterized protein n=1 Tax=Punica granatum TaxID=22663 RepID=A0A218WYV0_PUNGR|nr:hypothetical protein CDL15_Pgr016808 [Punica granatum]
MDSSSAKKPIRDQTLKGPSISKVKKVPVPKSITILKRPDTAPTRKSVTPIEFPTSSVGEGTKVPQESDNSELPNMETSSEVSVTLPDNGGDDMQCECKIPDDTVQGPTLVRVNFSAKLAGQEAAEFSSRSAQNNREEQSRIRINRGSAQLEIKPRSGRQTNSDWDEILTAASQHVGLSSERSEFLFELCRCCFS